jgi:HipA-like protein
MSYKTPPPTLLVSYADQNVAELKKVKGKYLFRYLEAFKVLNLSPLPGLPQAEGDVSYDALPLFFKERLPDPRRPEISDWLRKNQIDPDDDLLLLSVLGTRSITDPFVLHFRTAA